MTTNIADFVLHIDETLPPDQLKTIESHIVDMGGVLTATNRDDKPHPYPGHLRPREGEVARYSRQSRE